MAEERELYIHERYFESQSIHIALLHNNLIIYLLDYPPQKDTLSIYINLYTFILFQKTSISTSSSLSSSLSISLLWPHLVYTYHPNSLTNQFKWILNLNPLSSSSNRSWLIVIVESSYASSYKLLYQNCSSSLSTMHYCSQQHTLLYHSFYECYFYFEQLYQPNY